MAAQTDYDIFFSHARADLEDPESGPAIKAMLAALEAAGLRVFRDAAETDDSQSITERIVGALARSTLFLAWYSPTYPTRRVCQWELTAAILAAQSDPADAQALDRRIVVLNPVSGVDHIQPLLLRDRMTVDARKSDWTGFAAALKARLGWVQGPFGRIRASLRPHWYGSRERLGSNRFVGRVPDLWAVHDGLVRHGMALVSGAPVGGAGLVLVRGMGGIGKTLLAEEYALRFASAWPGGVFWLTASNADSPSVMLARVGRDLGLPDEDLREDHIHGALAQALVGRGPYLWVVDDLPATAGHDELLAWKAPTGNGHTLVTTRSGRLDGMGYCHSLERLDTEEALTLLTARRPLRNDTERAAALAILELLDNHALAMDVAGAAVASEGYEAFLDLLRTPSEDALDFASALAGELPGGHSPQIAATLLDSVRRLNVDGRRVLHLAALLAPAPIPRDFIAAVFGRMERDTTKGKRRASLGLKAVTAESLGNLLPAAEGQPESLSVHFLARRTPRHQGDTAPAGLRDAVMSELLEQFSENAGDIRRYPVLKPLLPHVRALTEGELDVAGADLLGWLARVGYERGAYRQAEADYRQALQALTGLLGPEHPNTLTSMNNLAFVLERQGDYTASRALNEETLAIRRRVQGLEHPDTLTSMSNLAVTLEKLGDYAAAKALNAEALAIRRQVLGPEHPDTLTSMNNLAVTLERLGDYSTARALHEEALAIQRQVLGPEHPDTLTAIHQMARSLVRLGDLAAARELFETAVEGYRRVLGPEHPFTLTSMDWLAVVMQDQGDPAGARTLLELVLEARRRILGPEHPRIFETIQGLALCHAALGDNARARELLETVVEARRGKLGPDHPETLSALFDLAEVRAALGEDTAALHRHVYERRLQLLGREHPDTRASRGRIGALPPIDPLTLAFRLVLAGAARPPILETLRARDIRTAIAALPGIAALSPYAAQIWLEQQWKDEAPPILWRTWVEETRGAALAKLRADLDEPLQVVTEPSGSASIH